MDNFGFDDSATYEKPTNPRESGFLAIQRCNKYLIHACQCIGANCSLSSCQKMKRVHQHAKSCRQKKEGGCTICKQWITLCCYHAKYCKEPKCAVHSCDNIKTKLRLQQLQKKKHQAGILKRRIEIMQNRCISSVVQTSLENSNSSSQPSPDAQLHSSPHLPQPDIGRKPATVVSPPTANAGLMLTTQEMHAHMQNPMSQMMSGVSNGMLNMSNVAGWEGYAQNPQAHQNPQPQSASQMGLRQQTHLVGGPGNMPNTIGNSSMGPPQVMPNPGSSLRSMQSPKQVMQQLLQIIKSPPSTQQQQQILAIFKSNPSLMAAFKKHRTAQQKQQQQLRHQELQQSLSSKDLLACKVCMDKERSAVFQPCGHFVSCWNCSNLLFNCPICRRPITHKIKTYFC